MKEALINSLMEQAQVFASAWSLVGSQFDGGNAMDDAEDAKAELRQMIEEALAQPEEAQSALSLFQSGFIDGREKGLKEALAQTQEPVAWREFIEQVAKQKPEKPDYWSSCSQCERNINDAEDLLEATPPQRTEPESVQQVGTIGHIGNGSTTLTRAIAPLLSKAQAQAQPEQEPVALPCCGYADSSAIKWNPYSQVVQCHNCGQIYTLPPQRTFVGLTDEEIDSYFEDQGWSPSKDYYPVIKAIEAKLKQANGYAEENT